MKASSVLKASSPHGVNSDANRSGERAYRQLPFLPLEERMATGQVSQLGKAGPAASSTLQNEKRGR